MKIERNIKCDLCGEIKLEHVSMYITLDDRTAEVAVFDFDDDKMESHVDICADCWREIRYSRGVDIESRRWLVSMVAGLIHANVVNPPDRPREP